jgi:hypothetical protein
MRCIRASGCAILEYAQNDFDCGSRKRFTSLVCQAISRSSAVDDEAVGGGNKNVVATRLVRMSSCALSTGWKYIYRSKVEEGRRSGATPNKATISNH